jgi:hypothetical protein
VTAAAVCGRELPQLNDFESERLDVRHEPVQRGPVGHGTHQQRLSLQSVASSGSKATFSAGVSRPLIRKA